MENKIFENNHVTIIGKIISDFQYSHESYGEKFYIFKLSVRRLSAFVDYIPIMVSEHLFNVNESYIGQYVFVGGQFRSFNCQEEKKNRLILSVFVKKLEFIEMDCKEDENQIFLNGYICKEPVYRKTPLGREITELIVAANRSYGKSDYIPCICWGRNARIAADFEVGTHIQIKGRIQSRDYVKKINKTQIEQRTAYEVSVNNIEVLE